MMAGLVVGIVSVLVTVHNQDTQMRRALMVQARSIDLALGWSSMYASIQASQSAVSPNASSSKPVKLTSATLDLSQHRERIAKICAVYPNCRAVYLMNRNVKGQIVFLLDSSPIGSALYLPPGTIYTEASVGVKQVFSADSALTEGPYKDRWGIWVSAFVPHTLPNNKLVVVGIDIEASDWDSVLWQTAILPASVTLAFLLVMLIYSTLWHSKAKQNEKLKKTHIQLLKLSHEDNLTGLPNRRLLEDRLSQLIASEGRSGKTFTVLYIDLDGFKYINDTLGHDAGDQLLCLIAARLTNTLRLEDTVARLSGDEFAILLPRIELRSEAELVADKIICELARPITIEDQVISVTASIGVVIFSDKLSTPQSLIKAADEAMYAAKKAGANQYYVSDITP